MTTTVPPDQHGQSAQLVSQINNWCHVVDSIAEENSYPTAVASFLPSQALFARFDPTGRFVAAGTPEGHLAIWDMDTRETARILEGHVNNKALTSVS